MKTNKWVYIELWLTEESKKRVMQYMKNNNIKSPNKDLHVTLIYSESPFDWEIETKNTSHRTKIKKFSSFWDDGESLVMELDSDSLVKRNKELVDRYWFKSSYSKYKPHITLSYDAKWFNLWSLKWPNFSVDLVWEKVEEIDT